MRVHWAGRSLRCGRVGDLDDAGAGCPDCAADGLAEPVIPTRTGPQPAKPGPLPPPGRGAMWRWGELLVPAGEPVSLGEGGTPLAELPRTALPYAGPSYAELPGTVLLKDERANPTGSFKDRLASAAVSRARHLGATTVALATSGNAGLAGAAYAAAAGLRCVVLTTAGLARPTADALHALGARLVLTETSAQRWTALRLGAQRLGWFPLTNFRSPPVSSHPAGVHGYRTIAYEIAESLGWQVPDWVVVPVSRGDGLFGVWAGFAELAELGWTTRVPRMLAVERFPSLSAALRTGADAPRHAGRDGPVAARSIADRQGTLMALEALRRSDGTAVSADDAALQHAARDLAASGLLLELSSAAVLPGARFLAQRGALDATTTVVLLATAGPWAQATLDEAAPGRVLTDPADPAALTAAVR